MDIKHPVEARTWAEWVDLESEHIVACFYTVQNGREIDGKWLANRIRIALAEARKRITETKES